MVLALLGIIFIQYKWIEQSIVEKQTIVDHKFHQVASHVSDKMTDFGSMAIISDVNFSTGSYPYSSHNPFIVTQSDTNFHFDTTAYNDSAFIRGIYGSRYNYGSYKDSSANIEINVFSDDTSADLFIENEQNISSEFSKIKDDLYQIDEVRSLVNKIKKEVDNLTGDWRLDSSLFAKSLKKQTNALGLVSPVNWGVYDNEEKTFIISPKEETNWDYNLSLFKDDWLDSGRYELRIRSKDNQLIWGQIFVMILLSILFIAIIIFVFIYAIRLVIKHKKISEIKSDFINNMTHEFKTPLASISLAADSVLHPKVADNKNEVKRYIDIIKAEKTKLNQHVETLLEVASLQKNDIEISLEAVDINAVLKATINKLELLVADRNCTVQLDVSPELVIHSNPYYLENIFNNIIENSIKYSPIDPIVIIKAEAINDTISITFEDKGIGMSKEQISKAFEHFYRAQKGNVHNTKGFGLGLSFVRYMVNKMNGTVRIKSELKKGTTVILNFPKWH